MAEPIRIETALQEHQFRRKDIPALRALPEWETGVWSALMFIVHCHVVLTEYLDRG